MYVSDSMYCVRLYMWLLFVYFNTRCQKAHRALLWSAWLHAFRWRVEMHGDVLGEFLKRLSSIPECGFVYS